MRCAHAEPLGGKHEFASEHSASTGNSNFIEELHPEPARSYTPNRNEAPVQRREQNNHPEGDEHLEHLDVPAFMRNSNR